MTKYTCHGVTRGGSRCARTVDNSGFCKDHPFEDGLVTKTGFAKLQGATQSAVSKWIAEGKITTDRDGFIEWKSASQALSSSRDPSRPLQRDGDKHEMVEEITGESDWSDIPPEEVKARYDAGRMLKIEAEARLAETKDLEQKGKLVPIEEVEADAEDVAIRLRSELMAVADHAAPKLAGMRDVKEIHTYLTDLHRSALDGMSSDFDLPDMDGAAK